MHEHSVARCECDRLVTLVSVIIDTLINFNNNYNYYYHYNV